MRFVSSATCTSGDPVSVSWVRYSETIVGFFSRCSVTFTDPPALYSHFFQTSQTTTGRKLFRQHQLGANEGDPAGPDGCHLAERDHLVGRADERHPVALLRRDAPRGDRLTLADLPGLQGREPDPLEREVDPRERQRVRAIQPLRCGHLFEAIERHRVLDVKVADPRPAEGLEVRSAAELLAELARDRTDVGPGRTGNGEGEPAVGGLPEIELRHADFLRDDRDALALSRHLVELASADLLRGVGGR